MSKHMCVCAGTRGWCVLLRSLASSVRQENNEDEDQEEGKDPVVVMYKWNVSHVVLTGASSFRRDASSTPELERRALAPVSRAEEERALNGVLLPDGVFPS